MKNIRNLERLQRLHLLIESENTGTPKELANQMGISERKVYQLIEELKDLNANIRYSRRLKTYFYENEFKLVVNISVTILSDDELTEVFGGSFFLKKVLPCKFYAVDNSKLAITKLNMRIESLYNKV
ncbi:HTH domain-containing protein [Ascidiimonas aurantiaca]|uniref:HTH domain-containing protein n=1 Tax=Ascidiimonas aurantiaca TaxID=1685432 RepID=UPI0030ED0531